jgi:urea transporter/murein DD-endopeptidase MepM/ murein hydrolase activator NlpD
VARLALRAAAEALLRPYAQIVFSRDPRVGALVLAAVAVFPRLALLTLVALAVAALTSLLFGLGAAAVREGGHGCTAVLTALALGVFTPEGGPPLVLVAGGAALAVILSASLQAVFAAVALPTHALPFVAATWVVHLAARVLPAPAAAAALGAPWGFVPASLVAPSWLDVPACFAFLHGPLPALLILAAVALHSRIALLLALIGGLVAAGLHAALRAGLPWSATDVLAGLNAMLAAIALGGIWFVPQPSSLGLAAVGAALAAVVTYALTPAAGVLGLPVLSLPFVVVTHLVLTAARRREQDRRPRSAPPAARPEEALASHRMRLRRFGDVAWLPFRLPFRGEWFVSQGHDGAHTHRDEWRHGLDFEGRDPAGRACTGGGRDLRDYACYGLPVVAAGGGTVALVVDGVADNPPGEINTRDNWGNAVVVAHGPALYSVYAHLQPRSLRVKAGDVVTAGQELGRCGNSGRSPTPHLHFQVQRAAPLGSPSLPVDFGDVVLTRDGRETLASRVVPAEGDRCRPVARDEAVARALAFPPGTALELVEEGGGRREVARLAIDLYGRHILRSDRARLFLEPYEAGFVVVELDGDPRSLLRYLLVALARVPFDQAPALTWREILPRRLLWPAWLRLLADLAAVIWPTLGDVEITYTSTRAAGRLEVSGAGGGWTTHASLALGGGSHRLAVDDGVGRTAIEVRPLEAAAAAAEREELAA